MKKKYHILLFFSIFVPVFLGLECGGQAMGLFLKRTFSSNIVETALVGLVGTTLFALWTRRRQKKSAEAA